MVYAVLFLPTVPNGVPTVSYGALWNDFFFMCPSLKPCIAICDQICENSPYGIFREDRDRNVYQ